MKAGVRAEPTLVPLLNAKVAILFYGIYIRAINKLRAGRHITRR
jgi:hypothetical protein